LQVSKDLAERFKPAPQNAFAEVLKDAHHCAKIPAMLLGSFAKIE
jgi:hypothetical protein